MASETDEAFKGQLFAEYVRWLAGHPILISHWECSKGPCHIRRNCHKPFQKASPVTQPLQPMPGKDIPHSRIKVFHLFGSYMQWSLGFFVHLGAFRAKRRATGTPSIFTRVVCELEHQEAMVQVSHKPRCGCRGWSPWERLWASGWWFSHFWALWAVHSSKDSNATTLQAFCLFVSPPPRTLPPSRA